MTSSFHRSAVSLFTFLLAVSCQKESEPPVAGENCDVVSTEDNEVPTCVAWGACASPGEVFGSGINGTCRADSIVQMGPETVPTLDGDLISTTTNDGEGDELRRALVRVDPSSTEEPWAQRWSLDLEPLGLTRILDFALDGEGNVILLADGNHEEDFPFPDDWNQGGAGGSTSSPTGTVQFLKVDGATGSVLWEREISSPDHYIYPYQFTLAVRGPEIVLGLSGEESYTVEGRSAEGDLLWTTMRPRHDWGLAPRLVANESAIAIAYHDGPGQEEHDVVVERLDPTSGDSLWLYRTGGEGDDDIVTLQLDSENHVVIVGDSGGDFSDDEFADESRDLSFVMKVRADGSEAAWRRNFPAGEWMEVSRLILDEQDNALIARNPNSDGVTVVEKLDADSGETLFVSQKLLIHEDGVSSFALGGENEVLIAGRTLENQDGEGRAVDWWGHTILASLSLQDGEVQFLEQLGDLGEMETTNFFRTTRGDLFSELARDRHGNARETFGCAGCDEWFRYVVRWEQ